MAQKGAVDSSRQAANAIFRTIVPDYIGISVPLAIGIRGNEQLDALTRERACQDFERAIRP